jgi:hypothetical protein
MAMMMTLRKKLTLILHVRKGKWEIFQFNFAWDFEYQMLSNTLPPVPVWAFQITLSIISIARTACVFLLAIKLLVSIKPEQ